MLNTLKIGPIQVSPGLLLAPMEEVTDLPFRSMCRRLGADLVYTEFVNAEGLIRHARRAHQKLEFLEAERPVGIQLYGAAELSMEQAAQIATAQNPDLIDINCGCWVSDVALRGAGAGLLRDLPRLREVVARVVRSTHLPVTVKTRLGWDAESIRIVEVARMLEDLGVQALTLHCRTRAQGHQGTVDYSWIPRIKEAVSIPVILNGDVTTPQDVARAFAETGCDGVMIGRGAIQNPWIFRQTRHYLDTGQLLPLPSLAERAALCLEHLRLAAARKGGSAALAGLRRHFSGYFRGLPAGRQGLPGAAALRAELAALKEARQVEERLLALANQADSLAA